MDIWKRGYYFLLFFYGLYGTNQMKRVQNCLLRLCDLTRLFPFLITILANKLGLIRVYLLIGMFVVDIL